MATEEVDFGSCFGKGPEEKSLQKILRESSDCTVYIGGVIKMEKFEHIRIICFKRLRKLSNLSPFNQILFFISLATIL